MLKILVAKWNEDFQQIIDYQRVSDHPTTGRQPTASTTGLPIAASLYFM
jgi:hypothetical protein